MNNYIFGAIDSNIFIYGLNPASPFHTKAVEFLAQAIEEGFTVTPQIIMETYNVLVDPKKTIQPLSPTQAHQALSSIYQHPACQLIAPTSQYN